MRVVTKLYLTFSLILLLLFFSSGFAYLNTGKVETQTTAIIATSAQLTSEAARLRQGLFRIQQILQAYRLDGDQAQDTRAPEQARAVLARMQAVLAPATALGHFLGESVRAQMLQQVGALQTLSAEVFALQAVNWQQQAAVTAQRQQLENSLMVVHSTFERLGNTLLSGDSFLQKTANAYQANLQQANNLVARAMFMTDIRALSTQQDLLANMQADIEDGFAELQDNLPALKAETDLLAAQQALVAGFWGKESLLPHLLGMRQQSLAVQARLQQIAERYQTMSAEMDRLVEQVQRRNLDSGDLIRQALRQLKQVQMLAMTLAIAVVLGGGYWLARQIRKPLHYASQVTARLMAGDYCQRINLGSSRKRGEL